MYESAIVDLDGTVYSGENAIDGATEGIERLRTAGIDVRFVTNNASRRPATYAERLRAMGISADPDDVVSSGRITVRHVREQYPAADCFVIGERPFVRMLREAGTSITETPDRADVLVVALDRSFDYDRLTDALHALDAETAFLATNPDATRTENGVEVPSTGGIVGAIEATTGREPDAVLGKPSDHAAAFVRERFGFDPARTLLIGDRLDTDVVLGNEAGMTTVAVLSGVADREEIRKAEGSMRPDHVLRSFGEVGTLL